MGSVTNSQGRKDLGVPGWGTGTNRLCDIPGLHCLGAGVPAEATCHELSQPCGLSLILPNQKE